MELNILDIFDSIEIKNDTRIPAEDLKVITELEKKFFKSRDFHFKMKELIENKEDQDYKTFEERYNNKSKFLKSELQEMNYKAFMSESYKFVNSIYEYFKNKYNCQSLNTIELNEKSKHFDTYERRIEASFEKLAYFENINKEIVLDYIFEELGGFNFEDKARQEVIEYLKKETKTYRGDKKRVAVKGKKVTILDLIYFDSWYPESLGRYGNYFDRMTAIIKAISLSESNVVDAEFLADFIENKCGTNNKIIRDYEINKIKTNKLKIFKNGRVDIEFTSTTNAINFAKEFLNYEI